MKFSYTAWDTLLGMHWEIDEYISAFVANNKRSNLLLSSNFM